MRQLSKVLCFFGLVCSARAVLTEQERLVEYHRRNNTWPPTKYVPDTPGWRNLFEHRFRQIAENDDRDQRYEGYYQAIGAAYLAPNFTQYGFGLARAPDDLMEALRLGIRDGVAAGPKLEGDIGIIDGDQPWFIDRPDLTERVLKELQHYPETWAGLELTPFRAYGFRLYRNNSNLLMHLDKSQTHVVSFILHIDSSEDAEPWPILIEDFNGNTHEVILKSGDLLFYESSKCYHGRPYRFKGSWYSSVFVHYYPKYGWDQVDHGLEKHYSVPPIWQDQPKQHFEIPLKFYDAGLKEPTCPHDWCQTEHSIKWSGPGEEGYWIAPTGEKFPFDPKPVVCADSDERCPEWAKWESNECKTNSGYMLTHCKKSCDACTFRISADEL